MKKIKEYETWDKRRPKSDDDLDIKNTNKMDKGKEIKDDELEKDTFNKIKKDYQLYDLIYYADTGEVKQVVYGKNKGFVDKYYQQIKNMDEYKQGKLKIEKNS